MRDILEALGITNRDEDKGEIPTTTTGRALSSGLQLLMPSAPASVSNNVVSAVENEATRESMIALSVLARIRLSEVLPGLDDAEYDRITFELFKPPTYTKSWDETKREFESKPSKLPEFDLDSLKFKPDSRQN